MIRNPTTGRKVKVNGATGMKIVKAYLRGELLLDQESKKLIDNADIIAKQAIQVKEQLSVQLNDIDDLTQKALKRIDYDKFIDYLIVLMRRHNEQNYCLPKEILAAEVFNHSLKRGAKATKKDTEAFAVFFKKALINGDIQLGGGKFKDALAFCGMAAAAVVGATIYCAAVALSVVKDVLLFALLVACALGEI